MADRPVLFVCVCLVFVIGTAYAMSQLSFGCFGSAGECLDHDLTCSNNGRVAIEMALYGHKTWLNCTPGVTDCNDACCQYNLNTDCFNVFIAKDIANIYRNCSEHACNFRTPRLVTPCTRNDIVLVHQDVSSYSVVQYQCVQESQIVPMCGDITSKYGNSISVIYDPRSQNKDPHEFCWCSVSHFGSDDVIIEGIDLRLKSDTSCGQVTTRDGKNTTYHDCNSSPLWPDLTIKRTRGSYTHVLLTGKPEFVWIRFRAQSVISVTCSLNGQHTTTTPTTTTTTPTTTTTTTTQTYPTAPGTVDTRSPGQPTRSSPGSTTMVTDTTPFEDTTQAAIDSATNLAESSSSTGNTTYQSTVKTSTVKGEQGASTGRIDDVTLYGALGGVIGAIVLIMVVVFAVCLCRRKDSGARSEDSTNGPNGTLGAANPMYDNVKHAENGAIIPATTAKETTGYSSLTSNPVAHTYDNIKPAITTNNNVDKVPTVAKPETIIRTEDEKAPTSERVIDVTKVDIESGTETKKAEIGNQADPTTQAVDAENGNHTWNESNPNKEPKETDIGPKESKPEETRTAPELGDPKPSGKAESSTETLVKPPTKPTPGMVRL